MDGWRKEGDGRFRVEPPLDRDTAAASAAAAAFGLLLLVMSIPGCLNVLHVGMSNQTLTSELPGSISTSAIVAAAASFLFRCCASCCCCVPAAVLLLI